MKGKYTSSLKRSGADTVWIENDNVQNAVRQALECDGLLLPGGADIDPNLYGQKRSEKTGKPNLQRDLTEPLMIKAFLDADKPIFCICRGCQMLNVYFGGTLIQDITDIQKYRHMDFLSRARYTHPLEIGKETLLASCLGTLDIQVNSMHHQAIEQVGEDLIVSAKSTDGFVEAIEYPKSCFCLGVQWHPEHMSKRNALQQTLFDKFVKAAGKEI